MSTEIEKAPQVEPKALESPPSPLSTVDAAALKIDPSLERKLLWKLDLRVIPILWFLFLVSFFDRSNIGNAKIAGLTKSLHMTGNDYNIAVTIFTVAYVVFSAPATFLVKKFGPRMLPIFMFTWGMTPSLRFCRFLVVNRR